MNLNLMLDIETLATSENALVLQVGAVTFDPITQKMGEGIVYNLSLAGQEGRDTDPRTVLWWAAQAPAAQQQVLLVPAELRLPVVEVLRSLEGSIQTAEYVWARGPSFDLTILNNLAATTQRTYPPRPFIPWYKWRDERPMRDLIESLGYGLRREGTAHNALDDARRQAKNVLRAYELVQSRKKRNGSEQEQSPQE